MQDHPAAHELLGELAKWLATELREKVPREERFGVLVAANVAAIVAREIAPGAPSPEAERERLARLVPGTSLADAREAQSIVARAIRSGELDDRWDEVVAVVRESVREKLAVAHPGYDDWSEPLPLA